MPIRLDDELARLLDLDPTDRRDVETLLDDPPNGTAAAMAALTDRLGTFPGELPAAEMPDIGEPSWICAIVQFGPQVRRWHAEHGVPESITRATLADVGRQFRLHRITHGRFGLETFRWLTLVLAGNLFHLGRLQFALRTSLVGWVLDVHIPPTGSMDPLHVQDSYEQATVFFAERFPQRPADRFVCFSWLLDPYLAQHLPGSNIAAFQGGFRRIGAGVPSDDDVLYFVFRTRSGPAELPRDTSLQRLVLDRIAAGESWMAWSGVRPLSG